MKSYRKLIPPISVTILLIVAGLTFLGLQPSFVGPPPILDPNFQLWVGDAGARRLMVWDLEYTKRPGDIVSLRETVVGGKNATQILLTHSGIDDAPIYIYLKQTIDGARLTGLLEGDIGIWVLTEPCACSGTSTAQALIFGVEINDGVHTITFIFSDQATETRTLLAHRFVYLPTQSGVWTQQHVNLTRQYALARWSLPDHLTFSLVFEAGATATGTHSAYVNSIHVEKPQVNSIQHGSSDATQSALFCDGRRLASTSPSPLLRIRQ
jgi:hypothetical protein